MENNTRTLVQHSLLIATYRKPKKENANRKRIQRTGSGQSKLEADCWGKRKNDKTWRERK